jgi:hypothetical protein
MNTSLKAIEQFTVLDPAQGREPTTAEWARSRADIERSMAGRSRRSPARRSPGRRMPVRVLVIGVASATAAVAALAAGPVLMPSAADKAIASWTPEPGSLTGADVLPQARTCAKGGVGSLDPATVSPSDVLLAEQRGAATLLIMKQGASVVECMMVGTDDAFASMALADGPLPPPGRNLVTVETQSSVGAGDGQYSEAVGLADPSVTGVDIVLADGKVIQTSTRSGWWTAWWPGPAGGEVDTFTVVVHTAGGTAAYRPSQL